MEGGRGKTPGNLVGLMGKPCNTSANDVAANVLVLIPFVAIGGEDEVQSA